MNSVGENGISDVVSMKFILIDLFYRKWISKIKQEKINTSQFPLQQLERREFVHSYQTVNQ